MNRTIIAAVTIIAVAAVAIFGLRTYTQATTAPSPVTVHDADVNWDKHINVADLGLVASKYGQAVPAGGRPVAEQNLDGNGNIKVHEQGVVSVNLAPAFPGGGPNLVLLASFGAGTVPYPGSWETPFFDVQGCRSFQIHIKGAPQPVQLQAAFDPSFDGVVADGEVFLGNFANVLGGSQFISTNHITNFGRIRLLPGQGNTVGFTSLNVYCDPLVH